MTRYSSFVVPMFVVLVAASGAPAAETITRKRDKPILGDVTGYSKTEIIVKVRTPKEDTIKVPANEVQNINWTGEPPEANLARSDEAGGKYQRAIDGYTKALQSGKASNSSLKVDLEYGVTRAGAKLALSNAALLDDAIKKLEEFQKKQPDHYRHFEALGLLGKLYFAKKDFEKARAAFDALAKAPWKETQATAKIASARLLAAEGRPEEAIAAFDAVIEQATDGESRRQEAVLGKAHTLFALRKFDEAQKLLKEVAAGKDVDEKVLAETYVRLGDCLREQGHDKDALLEYLKVHVLYQSDKNLHAEALFHLTRLWDKAGYKGRAAEARDLLASDEFKDTEWARQLK